MATLIKIDRNGSKYYEGLITCDRCGGAGGAAAWKETGWTCYKCNGTGKVHGKWIERTPEYQAKLDARRAAKAQARAAEYQKQAAEHEEEMRKAAEEQAARIAEREAEKAISKHVGQIGERITINATFDHSAWFTFRLGWSTETMYIHTFKDPDGNVLIWKTSSRSLSNLEEGDAVQLTGTVKDHNEYKGEKQTVLTRCKVSRKDETK